MNLIKPTPGRIVWYWPNGRLFAFDPENPTANGMPGHQPMPAIITHVWNDTHIDLYVLPTSWHRGGVAHSIELVQGDTNPPKAIAGCPTHFCEWMPFQKGQAALQTDKR